MASRTLAVAIAACAAGALAQSVPLYQKHFEYNALPYKVDTDTGGDRGAQYGFNLCNSTTENQQSNCQTAMVNSIDDFCVWGPPEPNSVVGNTEGEAVAWCTKPGRGTRLIPQGALTGVQFMKTPDYVQVVGFIEQANINMQADDSGGEMDPHGADQRGNPLGGVLFSNAFSTDKTKFTQVIEWHNFMGGGVFCMKACDPAGPNAAHYCEHVFDRIGCQYNAPAAYVKGVFESCEGESQDYPGVYTDAAGAVQTYTQPPESLGAITTMPYTARVPKSSNCVAATSSAIYTGLPTGTVAAAAPTGSAASSSGASSAAATGTNKAASGSSTARAGSSASASSSATPSANAAASTRVFDMAGVAVAGAMTFAGALMGVALL
ncbi:hypothetical protein RSOLAG22IIIB_05535 [Rhizoctonia solani]|uniref:Mannoprotein n=1 Tax=Rhizoctonia solani TaxID=456999 RepID=A0A0K6G7G3_9AGAM|nr:hypothetical protein RSOLAG22IIIB_05535 [Rhizoctonia solani]